MAFEADFYVKGAPVFVRVPRFDGTALPKNHDDVMVEGVCLDNGVAASWWPENCKERWPKVRIADTAEHWAGTIAEPAKAEDIQPRE